MLELVNWGGAVCLFSMEVGSLVYVVWKGYPSLRDGLLMHVFILCVWKGSPSLRGDLLMYDETGWSSLSILSEVVHFSECPLSDIP